MDDGLSRFREAADRENAERPVRRRYSPTLQREAVAALGVSMTTETWWPAATACKRSSATRLPR